MPSKYESDLLQKFLREKLPIIFEFEFNGLLLLCGGAIRDTMIGNTIKDVDFVLLTQEKENNISEFIDRYNLPHKMNSFGGQKLFYNGLEIDLFSVNDLFKVINYNIDGLFYDIHNQIFLPFGFNVAFESGKVEKLNSKIKHPQPINDEKRLLKIKSFYEIYSKHIGEK